MELTQRLECTQDVFGNTSEKLYPEQIGFLGICGTKYPVKKGPNKIGRDPQTCNIVLNLNSISRQHAVVNVLSNKEFMLMDLDSANKTKLQDKTLDPYIPQPLKNGDTVQFGQVFGIFRLLEEETDLPMTQAIEIPETPLVRKHISKVNHTTVVPESPEVSDRDDSIIAPSQVKDIFKSPNNNFLKSSGKTISVQPMGQNKIDNVYWNSSKKSDSFSMDNSNLKNESIISIKSSDTSNIQNIYEQDTQVPDQCNKSDLIYEAQTQVPIVENRISLDIHNMETQVPISDKLPDIKKVDISKDDYINLFAEDKENDISIFNAETQLPLDSKNNQKDKCNNDNSDLLSEKSDDVILFDEIDTQNIEENFESAILPTSPILYTKMNKSNSSSVSSKTGDKDILPASRRNRLNSDSSTDCDDFDILPTQEIKKCELTGKEADKNDIHILQTQIISGNVDASSFKPFEEKSVDEDITDCEDNLENVYKNTLEGNKIPIENMDTQVIPEDSKKDPQTNITSYKFEEMLTQIVPEIDVSTKDQSLVNFEDMPTQVIETDIDSSLKSKVSKQINLTKETFKVPFQSPRKLKKKDSKTSNNKITKLSPPIKTSSLTNVNDEDNFYLATQDILDDLMTQKDPFDETDNIASDKCENKVNDITELSSQEVRDVIGTETNVASLKRVPSDSSDYETTPRKIPPFKIMNTDLPNSQEIKTSVTHSKSNVTESSSESETETDSQQGTPILFKKKKKSKTDNSLLNLSKKLFSESLPTRISTRAKKPTNKLLNSSDGQSLSIFKSNFIMDQEDNIDPEIVSENIQKLKNDKHKKISRDSHEDTKTKSNKNNSKINKDNSSILEVKKEQHKSHNKGQESESNIKKESTLLKIDDNKSDLKSSKSRNNNKSNESTNNESLDKTDPVKEKKTRKPRRTKQEIAEANNLASTSEKTSSTRQTRSRKKPQKEKTVKEEDHKLDVIKTEVNAEDKRERRDSEEPKRKGILKRSSSHTDLSNIITEKRKRVKRFELTDLSPEQEVRRSRRQRTKKEEVIKKLREPSGYMSPSVDSPIVKKRNGSDSGVPAKKARPAKSLGLLTNLRVSSKRGATRVLLTAFPSLEIRAKLEELGAIIVSEVKECTLVLTIKIKRTFKLLCAVGLGKPIVGPDWVQACVDNKVIVDPWLYVLKDEDAEKIFNFSLQKTLAGKRSFLKGQYISSTPSVMPSAPEMKQIVECSGGTWKDPSTPAGPNWIVISCLVDKVLWPALKDRGAIVVTTEFILGGVLRQELDITRNRLA